jgi:DNA-binding XRE family transcriptional regulator
MWKRAKVVSINCDPPQLAIRRAALRENKTLWENPSLAFREEYEKLSIGEQLLKLRLQADMTQAEVAKKVGTTASAISRYENAEYDRYELQTLRKIVEACGGVLHVTVGSSDEEEAA